MQGLTKKNNFPLEMSRYAQYNKYMQYVAYIYCTGSKGLSDKFAQSKGEPKRIGGKVNFWLDWSEVYYIIDM